MVRLPKKVPDDVNQILKDIKEVGTKENLCKKYECTRQNIHDFLRRRGYKLEASTVWSLRPLSLDEKK